MLDDRSLSQIKEEEMLHKIHCGKAEKEDKELFFDLEVREQLEDGIDSIELCEEDIRVKISN